MGGGAASGALEALVRRSPADKDPCSVKGPGVCEHAPLSSTLPAPDHRCSGGDLRWEGPFKEEVSLQLTSLSAEAPLQGSKPWLVPLPHGSMVPQGVLPRWENSVLLGPGPHSSPALGGVQTWSCSSSHLPSPTVCSSSLSHLLYPPSSATQGVTQSPLFCLDAAFSAFEVVRWEITEGIK